MKSTLFLGNVIPSVPMAENDISNDTISGSSESINTTLRSPTTLDDLDSTTLHLLLPSVVTFIAVFGFVGNSLTLGAIFHVRKNYPTEFSLLQLPVTDLLINLSVCDLVYCVFGLPHMVHGMCLGEPRFISASDLITFRGLVAILILKTTKCNILGKNPYEEWGFDFCLWQGSIRNVVAIADINTMGMIAVHVYLQQRPRYNRLVHQFNCDIRSSVITGWVPERIRQISRCYLYILVIWVVSLAFTAPNIVAGNYK